MKKTAITMVVLLFATGMCAQKMQQRNVPVKVKSSFQILYPAARNVKWDKEGKEYEASFHANKTDNSVLLDLQGNIIETEVEIQLNQLPIGILEYVKTQYGKETKEGTKIIDAEGRVTYEVEFKGMDLIFDSNGKFIKEFKD